MTETWIAFISLELPKGTNGPAARKKLQAEIEKLLTVQRPVVTNLIKQGTSTPKSK